MRKYIKVFAVLAMMISLSSCGNTQDASSITETQPKTEPATTENIAEEHTIEPPTEPTTETESETTEIESESDTEAEAINLEIYNQDGVRVIYNGMSDDESDKEISFTLENHSGQYQDFSMENFMINGAESYAFCYLSADDGETATDYITIYHEELPEEGLKTIQFCFEITDDNLDTFTTAPITIDLESNTVVLEADQEAETEPPTEPKPLIGKDIDSIETFSYNGKVRNDVTGNWRCAVFAESGINVAEYAVSYYDKYMSGSDTEIDAVINLSDKTTTKIVQAIAPEKLALTVYQYVQGEEHDAKLMFSGQVLAYYMVNKETGEITEE